MVRVAGVSRRQLLEGGRRGSARSVLPVRGTKRTGSICRLTTEPSGLFSIIINCWVRKLVPTGITMRPPGFSCRTSDTGT